MEKSSSQVRHSTAHVSMVSNVADPTCERVTPIIAQVTAGQPLTWNHTYTFLSNATHIITYGFYIKYIFENNSYLQNP